MLVQPVAAAPLLIDFVLRIGRLLALLTDFRLATYLCGPH
jgi:hypothetical protein